MEITPGNTGPHTGLPKKPTGIDGTILYRSDAFPVTQSTV